MSAYICNPEHIGLLAAFAAGNTHEKSVIHEWRAPSGSIEADAMSCAEGLAKANIASVAYRYPQDRDGSRPGPGLYDAEIIALARLWARHYATRLPALPPMHFYSLANGFAYQACEREDWPASLAARQINWIKDKAAKRMPGADDAPWSWDIADDQAPLAIRQFLANLAETV